VAYFVVTNPDRSSAPHGEGRFSSFSFVALGIPVAKEKSTVFLDFQKVLKGQARKHSGGRSNMFNPWPPAGWGVCSVSGERNKETRCSLVQGENYTFREKTTREKRRERGECSDRSQIIIRFARPVGAAIKHYNPPSLRRTVPHIAELRLTISTLGSPQLGTCLKIAEIFTEKSRWGGQYL